MNETLHFKIATKRNTKTSSKKKLEKKSLFAVIMSF